jgi:hypothetical protein
MACRYGVLRARDVAEEEVAGHKVVIALVALVLVAAGRPSPLTS